MADRVYKFAMKSSVVTKAGVAGTIIDQLPAEDRVETREVRGKPGKYEEIVHPVNQYMISFVSDNGLRDTAWYLEDMIENVSKQ